MPSRKRLTKSSRRPAPRSRAFASITNSRPSWIRPFPRRVKSPPQSLRTPRSAIRRGAPQVGTAAPSQGISRSGTLGRPKTLGAVRFKAADAHIRETPPYAGDRQIQGEHREAPLLIALPDRLEIGGRGKPEIHPAVPHDVRDRAQLFVYEPDRNELTAVQVW